MILKKLKYHAKSNFVSNEMIKNSLIEIHEGVAYRRVNQWKKPLDNKKKTLYNFSPITISIALLASLKIATLFIQIHRLFPRLSLFYSLTQLCLTMLKTPPNLV